MILNCILLIIGSVSASGTLLGWKYGWMPADTSRTDRLAADSLFKLSASQVLGNTQSNCTLANTGVRREW